MQMILFYSLLLQAGYSKVINCSFTRAFGLLVGGGREGDNKD